MVDDGRFEIVRRGVTERHDATIETDVGTLAALVYEESSLDESLRTGHVKIEGDESVVERLLTLFPLPRSAAAAAEV